MKKNLIDLSLTVYSDKGKDATLVHFENLQSANGYLNSWIKKFADTAEYIAQIYSKTKNGRTVIHRTTQNMVNI